MTEGLLAVLGIAGAITLGAMSPGPSFVLVARTSVARSRADGLAMALAMGIGGVLFALAALAGVHVVLALARPGDAAQQSETRGRLRERVRGARAVGDRAAGGVMGLLGIKLIFTRAEA
jgi:threonine/homoserine/homoserine lactone efflux protein